MTDKIKVEEVDLFLKKLNAMVTSAQYGLLAQMPDTTILCIIGVLISNGRSIPRSVYLRAQRFGEKNPEKFRQAISKIPNF